MEWGNPDMCGNYFQLESVGVILKNKYCNLDMNDKENCGFIQCAHVINADNDNNKTQSLNPIYIFFVHLQFIFTSLIHEQRKSIVALLAFCQTDF